MIPRKPHHKRLERKPQPWLLRRQRAAMKIAQLKRIGKKGKENAKVNREKKREHIKIGITL